MDGVVKGLDKAMQSMDLEKVWNMYSFPYLRGGSRIFLRTVCTTKE